jgi:hypothetical protein
VKYDNSGHLLWKVWLSAAVQAKAVDIATDSAGNAYVAFDLMLTPNTDNPGITEAAIAKYNAAGVRQWIDFVGNANVLIEPIKLAVTPQGNVYVLLSSTPSLALIHKYDANGKQVWSRSRDLTGFPGTFSIALDAAENVYAILSPNPTTASILKYDSAGNLLLTFGADKLGTPRGFRVDLQGNSDFLGLGSPSPTTGVQDSVVAKFAADGSLTWLNDIGPQPNPQPVSPSNLRGIAVDALGDVFVLQALASLTSPGTSTDFSVTKFNLSGKPQWSNRLSHPDLPVLVVPSALAVNSIGDVYATGGPFTVKFNAAGNQEWLQTFTNSDALAMTIGGAGSLFVTGSTFGKAGFWFTLDYVQDAAQFSVAALTFGSQPLKTQSAAQTVTLTNSSLEVPLAITDINAGGDFALVNNCPSTLAPGRSRPLGVTFTPNELGTRTGVLSIRDNWAGSNADPRFVRITGTGTD